MRVLLADAQALVREGLKSVSLQIDNSCDFVEADDAASAREVMRSTTPLDVAWFDETFLDSDELSALRSDRPNLLLLALSARGAGVATPMPDLRINARVSRSAPVDV